MFLSYQSAKLWHFGVEPTLQHRLRITDFGLMHEVVPFCTQDCPFSLSASNYGFTVCGVK